MIILLLVTIIIIIIIILKNLDNSNNLQNAENTTSIPHSDSNQTIVDGNENQNIQPKLLKFTMYQKKKYLMTETELKFYRLLKNALPDYNVFSQVNLERIIYCKTKSYRYRNRIKSCSIDYVLTKKDNCEIICCIELDDYTHYYSKRIKRDKFINRLFYSVRLKLIRVNVDKYYNIDKIKEEILSPIPSSVSLENNCSNK